MLCSSSPLAGQGLPLLREYPGSGPYVCPTVIAGVRPTVEAQAQAGRLASDADQGIILGDLESAEELLARAVAADPTSADYAYRYGSVLDGLGRTEDAMVAFCRVLALGANAPGLQDTRPRLEALNEALRERLPTPAREAFGDGLAQADDGRYEEALLSFSLAIDEAPDWPPPLYNRGLMHEQQGRILDALDDFRRFLEISPTEVDPIVAMVSERIGLLEGLATMETPSPIGALALGFVPGMGHYYTGRPRGGTVVFALTGGALAAGLFIQDVTVVCLNDVPAGEQCPSAQVVEEVADRPFLLPSLGVAAAVTIIGAVDAMVRARSVRRQVEEINGPRTATGPRLAPPSLSSRGRRVDLNLLRVTFN